MTHLSQEIKHRQLTQLLPCCVHVPPSRWPPLPWTSASWTATGFSLGFHPILGMVYVKCQPPNSVWLWGGHSARVPATLGILRAEAVSPLCPRIRWWGCSVNAALSSSWSKIEKQWLQPKAHIFLALTPSVLSSLHGRKKNPEPYSSACAFVPLCPFTPAQTPLWTCWPAGKAKCPSWQSPAWKGWQPFGQQASPQEAV